LGTGHQVFANGRLFNVLGVENPSPKTAKKNSSSPPQILTSTKPSAHEPHCCLGVVWWRFCRLSRPLASVRGRHAEATFIINQGIERGAENGFVGGGKIYGRKIESGRKSSEEATRN
jgi:hypothetical protein